MIFLFRKPFFLMKKIISAACLLIFSNVCFSQSTFNLFYEYSNPRLDPQFVKVTDSLGNSSGANAANQVGVGINLIAFGSSNQSLHFAFSAAYRQITLNNANVITPKKISTVEYMLGGDFSPVRS